MDKHVVILQREIIVRGRNAEIRNKKMQNYGQQQSNHYLSN